MKRHTISSELLGFRFAEIVFRLLFSFHASLRGVGWGAVSARAVTIIFFFFFPPPPIPSVHIYMISSRHTIFMPPRLIPSPRSHIAIGFLYSASIREICLFIPRLPFQRIENEDAETNRRRGARGAGERRAIWRVEARYGMALWRYARR